MNATTTNLADFGAREINILIELLQSWRDQGLPEDFGEEQVVPMFNRDSGHVFLTNENCEVAMLNDGKLESYYSCMNCGHEGFRENCKIADGIIEEGCNQCKNT